MGQCFSPECTGTPASVPLVSTMIKIRDVPHFTISEKLY
jgi:hypothetical protein